MANTPRMNWPFPNENQDPWYIALENFAKALDTSGYAAREDRHLILVGGGTITWDAVGSTLQWTAPLQIVSPITGFLLDIPANTITIEDGQVFYGTLVRAPTRNLEIAVAVANQVPNTDEDILLAVRVGNDLHWRGGASMGGGGAGTGTVFADGASDYSYVQAASPIEEVVGQLTFDGAVVTSGLKAVFRATLRVTLVAAGTSYVRLYDLGPPGAPIPPRLVTSLSTTSDGQQYLETDLTVVSAAPASGEILDVARMYEIVVEQSATTGDSVYLGSAGINVEGV